MKKTIKKEVYKPIKKEELSTIKEQEKKKSKKRGRMLTFCRELEFYELLEIDIDKLTEIFADYVETYNWKKFYDKIFTEEDFNDLYDNEFTKVIKSYEEGDSVADYIYEQEIINCARAMDYLSEQDNSLRISLEIAEELGYGINDIDSEKLATLLYQRELYDLWEMKKHKIYKKVKEQLHELLISNFKESKKEGEKEC